MCLPRCKLFKLFSVSGAFVERKRESTAITVLDEYCKVHLQSEDAAWKSWVVNAIVWPNLHTNLILGLDFLARNKIVVDVELRMAIAKDSNYNLLNPPPPIKHEPSISPNMHRKQEAKAIKQGQAETWKLWQLVHCELFNLFKEKPEKFNFDAYTSASPDLFVSIWLWIKQVAGEKILLTLDAKYKASFKD